MIDPFETRTRRRLAVGLDSARIAHVASIARAASIASVASIACVACKSDPPPPAPTPLSHAEILRQTFAGSGEFVPGELQFSYARPDGKYESLIVRTKRRPTGGPFDPKSLYNCPTTTWRAGIPTVEPQGTCASDFGQPLTMPRCRLEEIWARAIEEGAKPGSATIRFEYTGSPMHQGLSWRLEADRSYAYDDDCTAVVEAGHTPPIAKRLPERVTAPATADALARAATAWLAEKHPHLVVGQLYATHVTADGTITPDGAFRLEPAAIWPDDKPRSKEHHYGGSAPFGLCRPINWDAARGWRLDEMDTACADVEGSPRCTFAHVLGKTGASESIVFANANWIVVTNGQKRWLTEASLACP